MRLALFVLPCFIAVSVLRAQAAPTLDEFLSNNQRVQDIKTIGLILTSQSDPSVAAKNAAELRKSFWAQQSEAGLSFAEAETELKRFDAAWEAVAEVIKERKISSVMFAGIDLVLLTKAQDWYFGAVTPRGPVLIRLSVQFNPNGPLTIHGIRAWTRWEEIKYYTEHIGLQPGEKVMTVTYEKAHARSEEAPK